MKVDLSLVFNKLILSNITQPSHICNLLVEFITSLVEGEPYSFKPEESYVKINVQVNFDMRMSYFQLLMLKLIIAMCITMSKVT